MNTPGCGYHKFPRLLERPREPPDLNPPTIIHIRFFDKFQSLLFEMSTVLERGNGGNPSVAVGAGPSGPTAATGARPGDPAKEFSAGFASRKSVALACLVGF